MDQKMILKFIFLFLTFSIEKSVSFKNELDSSIPHDDETKSLSIKCGLECIFKCLTGNANVIDYECLHVCLPNCTDSSKDVFKGTFEEWLTPSQPIIDSKDQIKELDTKVKQMPDTSTALQATIGQICTKPCNHDKEDVCDFCSTFPNMYSMTLKQACYDDDNNPCDTVNEVPWCNFCQAIKRHHWIEWDCHILCQLVNGQIGHKLNCSDPDLVLNKKNDILDLTLEMRCNDMCRNDWNQDDVIPENDFCNYCKMYQNYTIIHQTIREYCSNLGGNGRGTYLGSRCIQLKCANWEPYPDRRANHVENSKEDPLAPNLDDKQSTVVEDFRSLKIKNDLFDKNFEKSTINKQKQPHWIQWDCQYLCQLEDIQLNCSDPDLIHQTKEADIDKEIYRKCSGMCHDEWLKPVPSNEFCFRCKIMLDDSEVMHQTVSEFCRKIEKPDWWCIQLKCAEWDLTEMSAGKNYSLKVSRSVYLSNCINVPYYLWNMSTIHIIESYIVLQDLRIKKLLPKCWKNWDFRKLLLGKKM